MKATVYVRRDGEWVAGEITTEHPSSSYGAPVLVVEGDDVGMTRADAAAAGYDVVAPIPSWPLPDTLDVDAYRETFDAIGAWR